MRKIRERETLLIKLRLQQQALKDLYPGLSVEEVEEIWEEARELESETRSQREPPSQSES